MCTKCDATWFRMYVEWVKKRQGNGCYALEYLIFGNDSDDRVRVQKLKDSKPIPLSVGTRTHTHTMHCDKFHPKVFFGIVFVPSEERTKGGKKYYNEKEIADINLLDERTRNSSCSWC